MAANRTIILSLSSNIMLTACNLSKAACGPPATCSVFHGVPSRKNKQCISYSHSVLRGNEVPKLSSSFVPGFRTKGVFRGERCSRRWSLNAVARLASPADFAELDWLFDPLGLRARSVEVDNSDDSTSWSSVFGIIGGRGPQRRSGPGGSQSSPVRGSAAALEQKNIEFGDFFKGNLPQKFLTLLGLLALSRVGVYIPVPGINVEAFQSTLGEGTLLGTLDTLSGGGIGRVGIFSLGIVPFINAQIVFQLLAALDSKLGDLQKKEGEAGRKKFKEYTKYATIAFAIFQSVGQAVFLKPYAYDASIGWGFFTVFSLVMGAMIVLLIAEEITKLKLGNGTSLLIFTNIVSYLPASVGKTVSQAAQDGNYTGLAGIGGAFLLLMCGIVYVQEAERKIPINYASRYTNQSRRQAYLPFKVNSSGVMPIIFSSSLLAVPASLARFTGAGALKDAAVFFYPGGAAYLPTNVVLIFFFNYFYTFLQLDPTEVGDQLKRQGASVPGVRPGQQTASYIRLILERIGVLGSAFLAAIAGAPALVEGVTGLTAFRGFAGTSLLILLGSAIDTARKVEAEVISQKYKDFNFKDDEIMSGFGDR